MRSKVNVKFKNDDSGTFVLLRVGEFFAKLCIAQVRNLIWSWRDVYFF